MDKKCTQCVHICFNSDYDEMLDCEIALEGSGKKPCYFTNFDKFIFEENEKLENHTKIIIGDLMKKRLLLLETISHLILAAFNLVGFLFSIFDIFDFGKAHITCSILFAICGVLFLTLVIERCLRFKIESKILNEANKGEI